MIITVDYCGELVFIYFFFIRLLLGCMQYHPLTLRAVYDTAIKINTKFVTFGLCRVY